MGNTKLPVADSPQAHRELGLAHRALANMVCGCLEMCSDELMATVCRFWAEQIEASAERHLKIARKEE
jgi:hypothetical protein